MYSKKMEKSAMARGKSQASGSAALRAAAVLLCVMLFTMDSFAAAANVVVGGSSGWVEYQNYGTLTINTGDTLVFNYNPSYHSVLGVSYAAYSGCVTSSPIGTYTSGDDYITLNTAGSYYFICGTPNHCDNGMKVAVKVQ